MEQPAATSKLQLARSVRTTSARAAISVALMPPLSLHKLGRHRVSWLEGDVLAQLGSVVGATMTASS